MIVYIVLSVITGIVVCILIGSLVITDKCQECKDMKLELIIERVSDELQRMSKVLPLADKRIIDDLEEVRKYLGK